MLLFKPRWTGWLFLAVVVFVSLHGGKAWAAAPVASAPVTFPEIRMEDQFRTAHTPDSFFGDMKTARPLVLIAGDQRKTDGTIRTWVDALKSALGERIQCIGLANLRGLPFFVSKNSVRSSLKKKLPDVLVLCDWNGSGFKQFACVRGRGNVQVYAKNRTLVGTVFGTADAERLKEVVALAEQAMSAK